VVVSGKGGVGKTSITASLAVLLHESDIKVVAADCDVDAPNLDIILGSHIQENIRVKASEKALIVKDKCLKCGKCVDVCTFDAISWIDKTDFPEISTLLCEGCGACAIVCPSNAISIGPVENGSIELRTTEYGFPLITGRLDIGGSASGKIVSETKNKARNVASENNADVLLVDGPPGSGCPAISSISNSDFVILVTEPTPAAKHDFMRVYRIVRHFQIPAALILNKADIYTPMRDEILIYSKMENLPLIGEIPYDRAIPESISHGVPIIKFREDAPSSQAIMPVYQYIKDHLLV